MSEKREDIQETDRLQYSGYKIPLWVVLPWIVLAVYCVYYLSKYMWPSLVVWLKQ